MPTLSITIDTLSAAHKFAEGEAPLNALRAFVADQIPEASDAPDAEMLEATLLWLVDTVYTVARKRHVEVARIAAAEEAATKYGFSRATGRTEPDAGQPRELDPPTRRG